LVSFDCRCLLSFDFDDFEDFFCSFSLLLLVFLFIINDDEDFVEREKELTIGRFFVVDNLDDEGDAERYDRVVVVDDAGEDIFSLK
jgi:hypothetical protein